MLVALYVARSLYALALDETFTFNILVTLLVLVVLAATLVLTNLLHHRRAFSRPRRDVRPNVLLSWTFAGRDMVLTEELLRVAGFLATFGGLSLTVYLVTDATYREEFRTDMASEVREVFAVRDAYLLARAEAVN